MPTDLEGGRGRNTGAAGIAIGLGTVKRGFGVGPRETEEGDFGVVERRP